MNETAKKAISVAVAGTIAAGVPVTASAAEMVNNEPPAIYSEASNRNVYVVKEGDTLRDISRRYFGIEDYADALAAFNNIENPDHIDVGQELNMPRDILELLGATYSSDEPIIHMVYEDDKTYTVKEGDNLYKIIKELYYRDDVGIVNKFATYNNLTDPNHIEVGQELKVPCEEKLSQVISRDYTEAYENYHNRENEQTQKTPRPLPNDVPLNGFESDDEPPRIEGPIFELEESEPVLRR